MTTCFFLTLCARVRRSWFHTAPHYPGTSGGSSKEAKPWEIRGHWCTVGYWWRNKEPLPANRAKLAKVSIHCALLVLFMGHPPVSQGTTNVCTLSDNMAGWNACYGKLVRCCTTGADGQYTECRSVSIRHESTWFLWVWRNKQRTNGCKYYWYIVNHYARLWATIQHTIMGKSNDV